jgi:hypothetical protein
MGVAMGVRASEKNKTKKDMGMDTNSLKNAIQQTDHHEWSRGVAFQEKKHG